MTLSSQPPGHLGFVLGTRFDDSGRLLFSVSIEGQLCVWDVHSRELVNVHRLHDGPVNDIDYCAGSIASAGHDGKILVTTAAGDRVQEFTFDRPMHAVALTKDLLAAGGRDGSIELVRHGVRRRLRGHTGAIECLAIVDGLLLSGSRDASVCVWHPDSGARRFRLTGHTSWVTQIAAVGAGRALSVGEDGLVILWDCVAGAEVWRVNLTNPIWGLAVDRAIDTAYVGVAGPPVALDLQTRALTETKNSQGFAARAISVSGGGLVALGHDGGGIDFLERGHDAPSSRIVGAHPGILSAVFDRQGCLAGHANGCITFRSSNQPAETRTAHQYMAYASVGLPDQQVAIGSFDGSVSVWDTQTRSQTARLDHRGEVFSLAFSASSGTLLSAGDDHWTLWNVIDWERAHLEDNIGSGNHTLASASADGRVVVSVGEDARLRMWRDKQLVKTVKLPYQNSSAIALSADKRYAVLGFNDGVVGTVDLENADLETADVENTSYRELHNHHDSWIRQIVVSADTGNILSCSQNGIAVLYEQTTREATCLGAQPVAAVGFTPEGTVGLVLCDGSLSYVSG